MSGVDPSKAAAMAGVMAQLGDVMSTVIEATTGYRSQCEAAGFAPAAAEMMAVEYHRTVLAIIIQQYTKRAGR